MQKDLKSEKASKSNHKDKMSRLFSEFEENKRKEEDEGKNSDSSGASSDSPKSEKRHKKGKNSHHSGSRKSGDKPYDLTKNLEQIVKDKKSKEQKESDIVSATTYGYTFKLPNFDASVYITFIDHLIFGSNRREAIMQPIPPAVGQLKFCIGRNKNMLNKLTPSFYLYLEKNNGGRILVLYGKKMPFKKQSYYMICLEKNKQKKIERESDNCLGKLRATTNENDKFVLYDNGENPTLKGAQFKNLRKEHGAFIYRYEPCNVGNIRKMIIIFPAITCININPNKKDARD